MIYCLEKFLGGLWPRCFPYISSKKWANQGERSGKKIEKREAEDFFS
jgi:hypothetical protein